MSIWTRIGDALAALAAGESLADVFERLRTPPERTVGFAIAVIALSAKMAKADGQVTRNEVRAFREIFHIPSHEEANAARVFNLARQDVAGYDAYARRIASMFDEQHQTLSDLLEGLFHVALADGEYHPGENEFLTEVAEIFGLTAQEFATIRARFAPDEHPDPFAVLGIPAKATIAEARKAWQQLVRDTHPDAMQARGVPTEAIKLAEKQLIQINRAWEMIQELERA